MANLSPSELASLLGPVECVATAAQEESHCWHRFTDEFAGVMTARLRPLVRAASRVQLIGNATLSAAAVIANHDSRSIVGFWQSNRSLEPFSIVLSPSLVTTFVDRLQIGRASCRERVLVQV